MVHSYHCDEEGRILVPEHDELDNSDTQQWCELHQGHCPDVVPVRRCFDVAPGKPHNVQIFFACQACVRALKKAELIQDSKYAGLECYEVVVPRALSRSQHDPIQKQSFEVTLDALQVKYLRALGLRVIAA